MKSIFKLVLSLSLTPVGLLGLQQSAMALTTINANICALTDSGPAMIRTTRGIENPSDFLRIVVCPIVRTAAAPAAGFSVWVDGSLVTPSPAHAGEGLFCALDSYNYNGQLLGSTSLFTQTPGNFDRLLTLPQSQAPTFSHQALTCTMPAFATLFDIEPTTP